MCSCMKMLLQMIIRPALHEHPRYTALLHLECVARRPKMHMLSSMLRSILSVLLNL